MFKKIKRYLLLIPLLFVMLLNVSVYGQILSSSAAIDYNSYFKPVSECPHTFDFTDIDSILNEYGQKPFYFYAVYMTASEYEKYISGSSYEINFRYIDFDSDVPLYESSYIVHYKGHYAYCTFTYDAASDSFREFVSSSQASSRNFIYYKNTGSISVVNDLNFYISDYDNEDSCDERIYYYQCTNIPDFPLFYDYESAASALNVEVVFTPQLSGEVDRSVTLDDGSTALKNSITMAVYNRSNFDVQYQIHIYKKDDYPESGGVAPGVYSVFTYYEKDWVYSHDLDSNADWWNKVEKQYKATHCHLVWSGRTDVVTFDFNQLPLSEGVDYTVVVSAVRNDYKYASEHYVSDFEDVYPDLFQVQGSQIVFRSDFSMKQYSDVKYDRNNTNNGVLPYQGKDDKQQYDNSYYAKEDDSGNVDYEGKDVYNDPSSWYNNNLNHDFDPSGKWFDGLVGDKESGGSSDGTFTSFASSFTNYFQFLSLIFNYFPVGIKNVFLIGFVGIMAVVLLKVVFKS